MDYVFKCIDNVTKCPKLEQNFNNNNNEKNIVPASYRD